MLPGSTNATFGRPIMAPVNPSRVPVIFPRDCAPVKEQRVADGAALAPVALRPAHVDGALATRVQVARRFVRLRLPASSIIADIFGLAPFGGITIAGRLMAMARARPSLLTVFGRIAITATMPGVVSPDGQMEVLR